MAEWKLYTIQKVDQVSKSLTDLASEIGLKVWCRRGTGWKASRTRHPRIEFKARSRVLLLEKLGKVSENAGPKAACGACKAILISLTERDTVTCPCGSASVTGGSVKPIGRGAACFLEAIIHGQTCKCDSCRTEWCQQGGCIREADSVHMKDGYCAHHLAPIMSKAEGYMNKDKLLTKKLREKQEAARDGRSSS